MNSLELGVYPNPKLQNTNLYWQHYRLLFLLQFLEVLHFGLTDQMLLNDHRAEPKFVEMDEIRQMEQNIDKEDKEVMN